MLIADDRDEFRRYDKPEPLFGTAPLALLEGLSQMDNCEIHVISAAHKTLQAPTKIYDNIWFHSLKVPKLGWRATSYAGCVTAIRKKLREIQPDIVHGQGTERYCALAAVFSGFPNVITIHGNMLSIARFFKAKPGSFHWCAAIYESFALKRTARVLCNSAYTEKTVRLRTDRISRVPNALRLSFFQTPPSNERTGVPIILNIGLIAPHKCQVEILKAARGVFEAGHHFELRFIGPLPLNTSYGADFRSLIEKAERDGFATYIGTKSEGELLRCYDEADALVHFPREESFGLVVAEALARNLKLFGCRIGGVIDIADGVDLTELYEPDDWDGLSTGIARWIDDGHQRPQLAANEMAKRYHPVVIARKHIEIYSEMLSQRQTT